jgi:ABC-type sulfate/molybdate transport systems ATPase subunit
LESLEIDIVLARRAFDLRACLSVGSETVALVGPSGAGKTSLLRAVAGLDRPGSGRIALGNETWFDAGRGVHLGAEHRRVGYLPQDYGLFPHLSVAGNVRFAGRRDRPDLLEQFGIAQLANARPGELSGGERQRVALARAVAREPRVLLLDEPFGALDAITRRRVRDELADVLSGFELPSLLVTHSFDDAIALANRVGVIDYGELVQLDSARQLYERPASALVAELTGANVLRGRATPNGSGADIELEGGGRLTSSAPADGVVTIAIQPWELKLVSAGEGTFDDTVLSVHSNRGTLVIRTSRVTIELRERSAAAPHEGAAVGVRVAPDRVRVLPAS